MNSFADIEDKLKADVNAGMKEEVLLRLFENSKVLENDICHYKRHRGSIPDAEVRVDYLKGLIWS